MTLLQLRDGSMYGLTRYWVEGNSLHYVTDYGGSNSVALDHIDVVKTKQLTLHRELHLSCPPLGPPLRLSDPGDPGAPGHASRLTWV